MPSADDLRKISCVTPLEKAWSRMTATLFRKPFRIGKWFALGFSAWLATLAKGCDGVPSVDVTDFLRGAGEKKPAPGLDEMLTPVVEFAKAHLGLIAWVVALAVIAGLAIGILILWLNSRGKFMFLDNVVNDRAEVVQPWHAFARRGNSLFAWTLVFNLICLGLFLVGILLVVFGVVMPCIRAKTFVLWAIPIILLLLILVPFSWLVSACITRFLDDFVVPVMYRFDLTATEAWRRVLVILRRNFGQCMLYWLFYLLLSLTVGAGLSILVLITCCCAGIFLWTPYVGAVVLLPVTVFFRVYSLEYFAQYGDEYRLLEPRNSGKT